MIYILSGLLSPILIWLLVTAILEAVLSYRQRRADTGLAQYLDRRLFIMERDCPENKYEVRQTIHAMQSLIREYEADHRRQNPGRTQEGPAEGDNAPMLHAAYTAAASEAWYS